MPADDPCPTCGLFTRITFLIHTFASFAMGTILIFVPSRWATFINWTPFDPYLFQIYGVGFIALGTSSWLAYRATSWMEIKITVKMEIVYTLTVLLVGLYGAFIGDAPKAIWVLIISHAIFAVAWIVLYVKNRKGMRQRN